MLEALFVVQLDDYHGFIVKKRYPSSLSLNEKVLNLVFFAHQQEKKERVQFSEIEGMNIVSYSQSDHPGWIVCYVIESNELDPEEKEFIPGMGRLILELMSENPDEVDIEEILKRKSTLPERNEEQRAASVFLTPSASLILERMQTQGVDSAAKLSIWLKDQIQSDDVNIRDAIKPLIKSGIVKVEMISKTKETVFLLKDIFNYRAPPVLSLQKSEELYPEMMGQYRGYVTTFFSPPPPNKGYNPTIPDDDPNSPLLEDRENIARVIAKSLHYTVLQCVRNHPMSLSEKKKKTALPETITQSSLWALETNRVVAYFEEEAVWGLITNPIIETFMPEYTLQLISRKLVDKEISPEIGSRYLELLIEVWSDSSD
ncbi:MAG: hypothetical protein ACTSQZ_04160 [Candidatus Thorarchaeota archaeon]